VKSRKSHPPQFALLWILIICLFVAIAIPNLSRSRVVTAKDSCINSLRQIEGAKTQLALMHHELPNDAPTWYDLRPSFTRARLPLECPDGGVYTIGRVDEVPSCSIARHIELWRTNRP
jgi:hypothetical protein